MVSIGRWKLLYKGSGSSAIFRYPFFGSASFCSKPAEGSGRQRKCAKRVAKMRTCAFSLSFKGSAEGSGGSAHGVAKMRKGSENAQRQRGTARRQHGAAKMRHNCAFALPRAVPRFLLLRCQFCQKLAAHG